MARQAKLFLIRHGETVDNVAQLYAGSRDSALTNHGHQQAIRLGQHFKSLGLSFTHIFSSHLQRAAKTAGLIRDAQATPVADDGPAKAVPEGVQLPVLMEQDFGFYEGKKFHERLVHQAHKDEVGFVDVESKESMGQRADAFLDGHLLPLLNDLAEETELVIAIVSHGIMLSTLWKRLLLRLPPKSVALSPELAATAPTSLEHHGGWSNTGYLELHMTRNQIEDQIVPVDALPARIPDSPATDPDAEVHTSDEPQKSFLVLRPITSEASPAVLQSQAVATEPRPLKVLQEWMTVIQAVNSKAHLNGLKRTAGGVGSARHDASQKTIDSFFKRRKLE